MVRAGGFGANRRGPARRLAVACRRNPPQRSRRAAEATPLTPDPTPEQANLIRGNSRLLEGDYNEVVLYIALGR